MKSLIVGDEERVKGTGGDRAKTKCYETSTNFADVCSILPKCCSSFNASHPFYYLRVLEVDFRIDILS